MTADIWIYSRLELRTCCTRGWVLSGSSAELAISSASPNVVSAMTWPSWRMIARVVASSSLNLVAMLASHPLVIRSARRSSVGSAMARLDLVRAVIVLSLRVFRFGCRYCVFCACGSPWWPVQKVEKRQACGFSIMTIPPDVGSEDFLRALNESVVSVGGVSVFRRGGEQAGVGFRANAFVLFVDRNLRNVAAVGADNMRGANCVVRSPRDICPPRSRRMGRLARTIGDR